jgi:hypothetical protein
MPNIGLFLYAGIWAKAAKVDIANVVVMAIFQIKTLQM